MTIDRTRLSGLLPPGSRVLCAVSGGADSMCLLHLLWSRREELGLEVLAAHYEHGLRGEEALRDAAFVEGWCRERGIPCAVEHGDVAAQAARTRRGLEETARELRYAFLERTADRLGCDKIATAHNADDNAETLLLHLVRGSGAAGLGGIPPARGRIVRPLLELSREEIEAYLAENGVAHVEDSSNASDAYSRNLLRHQVLPVLRQLNPRFAAAALRTAELLRQDEACLSALAEDFIRSRFDGESLPAPTLGALPFSVASRAVRKLCPRSLSREQVDAVLALTEGTEPAWADLPGLRVRRERGRLYFVPEAPLPVLPERTLTPGESLELPELGLRLRAEPAVYREEINDLFKTYCFKIDTIYGKIICAARRPGDSLRPQGRGCTKSLKKLFAEAGLTREQRASRLVFRDEKGVLAVQGLAIDERAAPSLGDRVLRITAEKIEGERET